MASLHRVLLSVVIALLALSGQALADTPFPSCVGKVNNNPFVSSPPTLISTVTHGKRYLLSATDINDTLHVVHLYGTPYEQGYALGQLFKSELFDMAQEFYAMISSYVDDFCQAKVPSWEWLCKVFESYGIKLVLEGYSSLFTERYTPQFIKDEIKGMSDASGFDYAQLLGINMFPDIIKAGCSMVGSWGPAVADHTGLHQLRALMLKPHLTIQKYPTAVIYHPTADDPTQGVAHVNFGFLGNVGVFTGYNANDIGISEKAFETYNGTYTPAGEPWAFMLREILRYDATAVEATARMRRTQRTCSIFVGVGARDVGDGTTNQLRGYAYGGDSVEVYDDRNASYYPTHPQLDGVFFIDEYNQPSTNPCYGELMTGLYGNHTAENFVRYVAPLAKTGGLHTVAFDFEQRLAYVANAAFPVDLINGNAFDRTFFVLDLAALLAEPAPAPQ